MKKDHYKKGLALLLSFLMLLCTSCSGTGVKETIDSIDPNTFVTLGQYKGLTVSAIDATVSEGDIEAAVMNDLKSLAEKKNVEGRPVIDGDIVNIDYKGMKDGEAFEGGTGNNDLEIGSGTFIPGFEDGVIGMEIGETKDLKLTFPEDYSAEDLAGQDVVFEVTVNSISENDVPSITDKGILEKISKKYDDEDFADVDAYFGYIKDNLEKIKKEDLTSKARTELLQMAYDNAECDIEALPEWLISENATNYINSIESFATQYGVSLDEYMSLIGGTMEESTEQAMEYGKELSKQQLVVRAIAGAEGIEVTEKEIEDYYTEKAKEYSSKVETLKNSVDEETIKQFLLSDKVQDFLFDNAEFTEEK